MVRTVVRWPCVLLLALLATSMLGAPRPAAAQLGQLASPGPLSRAHASLEGVSKCTSCHEPGRKVTASKCLSCHQPIAARIAARRGVHRDVTDQCVACHAEHNGVDAELRPFNPRAFNHAVETGFALDGHHAGLACNQCHKTRSFLTVSPSCASCHRDVHAGSLGSDCASCHSPSGGFKDAMKGFDHSRAAFPLTGQHQQVACARCHVNRQFKGVRFDTCARCHTDPHRQRFGTACSTCHTTAAWTTRRVDHARTAFPLAGQHAEVPCARCHVQSPVKVKLKFARCADCHNDPHKGRFKEDCATCHTVAGFGAAAGAFDHAARTGFALTGRHATLECAHCHTKVLPARAGRKSAVADFSGAKPACASCHEDPHRGEVGTTCTTCHGTDSFHVTQFQHPRQPDFFAGQHADVSCVKCHARMPSQPARTGTAAATLRFKGTSTACASCHTDVHLGQLGTACESCHRIDAAHFAPTGFDHARSAFPLTGRHQQVACDQCHRRETGRFPAGPGTARRFKGLDTTCRACHSDPHLGQVGTHCETCHTTATFQVKRYTHAALESFFVGRHATLECVQCHKREEGTFPSGHGVAIRFLVGTECTSCHRDSHAGRMGTECSSCHTPLRWNDPNRAFHKGTVFPLTGRHLAVACASCHVNGTLKGTPTACYDCHWVRRQDDYYQLRLGAQCEDCHRTTSWTAVLWDHGARTGLTLNLSHRLLACDTCHKDRVFAGRRTECIACHEPQYRQVKDPDHVAAGFPFTCDLCHSPAAPTFAGARFTHASYVLRGAHATQACAACHGTGVYQGTPRDCYACHRADYERTQNPNHAAAGFPTTCDTCHQEGGPGWRSGSGFNHAQFFALNGRHATADCAACHRNGVYAGTPKDCVACHQADYQRTTNPNHAAAGFPTACEQCHRSGGPGWTGASFNHAQFFALVGVHASQPCSACHKNGVYQGTPTTCAGCHLAQYQRTTNPNHAAAGFPTTCDACHRATDGSWNQGRFNHTWFPITSGRHSGFQCSACHTNPSNYQVFSCLTCHGRSETDSHHSGVAGYRYDSIACYTCHPTGRAE